MTLLNYYPVAKDGQYSYYEFILFNSDKISNIKRSPSWIFR